MTAIWSRARTALRDRWRAHLALTLLVGVGAGVVLMSAAGARRTASSFDRFVDESRVGHVSVVVGETDPALVHEVEALPEVEAVAILTSIGVEVADAPFYLPIGASVDGRFGVDFERTRIVEGRQADPADPHEVVINEKTAEQLDLDVGDRLPLVSYTPEQIEQLREQEQQLTPEGPEVDLRVVGLERRPSDVATTGEEGEGSFPILTPAFVRTYGDEIGSFSGRILAVRLRGGSADIPAFSRAVEEIYADTDGVGFEPDLLEASSVQDSIGVLAVGLALVALAVGLAGLVAVGQTISRQASLEAQDHPILDALGMTPSDLTMVLLLPRVVVAVAGAVLAGAIAVAGSPLLPIGVARRAEPDPGVSIDVLVLGLGLLATVGVTVAIAAWCGWRATRRARFGEVGDAIGSVRTLPNAAGRAGLPAPAVAGIRMAVESGRGATAVPVRPAMVGAVVGVAGLVATLVFGSSLDRLVDSPASWGWTWDVAVGDPQDRLGREELRDDPDVEALADVWFVNVILDGRPTEGVGVDLLKGSVFPTVVAGRAPSGPDEVALGADTLERLGLEIGDSVEGAGRAGTRRYRVVGRAAFPTVSDPAALSDGAAFTYEGLRPLDDPDDLEGYHQLVVRWGPGVDETAANRGLEERTGEAPSGPTLPADIEKLTHVQGLPRLVALFLALIGVFAVGHALVAGVRRRRRDLAVLKTVGFTPGGVSTAIAWQATTVALAGVIVGVPLGIIAGRAAWSVVANGLGIAPEVSVPVLALAITIPVVVLVFNAVAVVPGRRAGRTSPADALRAD